MSYLLAAPDALVAVAADVAGIGSSVSAAYASAAPLTSGLPAAAGDEVSAAIAALLGDYGRRFAALGARASVYHTQFVQALSGAGAAYVAAEAANANPLQTFESDMLAVINAPTEALLGRPLIGNGAAGASGAQGQGVKRAGFCSATAAPGVRVPGRGMRVGLVGRPAYSAPAVPAGRAGRVVPPSPAVSVVRVGPADGCSARVGPAGPAAPAPRRVVSRVPVVWGAQRC